MKLEEAIERRISARAFLDKPVDKALIEEILALAVQSPSWGNTQPWEIVVAGGEAAKALTDEFVKNLSGGMACCSDMTMPENFSGVFMDRYRGVGKEVFRLKGIGREDKDARFSHYMNNFRGFGAPCLVYLVVDECLESYYPMFDCGLLAAHICLLAASRGLDTCLLAALAWYPDSVRKHLNLGPEKKVVLGIALGYADPDDSVNQIKAGRAPLDQTVTWVGMD